MLANLETLVRRYDELNRLKTERALGIMSRYGQQVFHLLPVLLHFNHPLLPGYVSGRVPHGICHFIPNGEQQSFIDDICLTAHCSGGLATTECSILGLYTMGSTSSIGQCCHSDLDIWVCHSAALDSERLEMLEHKCLLLSRWAEQRGTEVNFFLIPENKFRQSNSAEMEGESCGSAQHLLLLDEFYRSAMCLAGKRLLWYLVPLEQDEHYDDYVASLFRSGALNPEEWLDLGSFNRIPAEEYFGSALWQLYKGIDSPYKAVLKTVLMEAYSHEYPETKLLSVESKRWFQHNEGMSYRLDGYCLMLDKVTNYLKSIGDMQRLDLVRRCFYLKVCDGLSDHGPTWRREQLVQLVSYWGWSEEKIRHLDHRRDWKVGEVKVAYAELLEALMQSYRNLILFARRNNISESINPEDIGILSRKLYAAFESLPGKVQRINLKIAPDLGEPDLSFIQVPHGRLNRAGWYLYKHSLEPGDIIGRAPLEYNGYISKLVAWSYFNGLMTTQSRVHLFNQGSDLHIDNLHQFCRDLSNTFPVKYPAASNLALSRPCEIRQLAIFLNLEVDPSSHWVGQVIEFDANTADIFSFGRNQECLVGTIDLVYRNSWSEIRTLHFRGEEAVVDALTTILGKMHQDAAAPERIEVFCYSQHFRSLVRARFQQLMAECIELRLARDKPRLVKTLALGQEKYGIFFERRGVSVKKLENAVDFYRHISHNKLDHLPLRLDKTHSQHLPAIVDAYASEGLVQFFFENQGSGFNIYILDEANRVEVYQHFAGNKEELVQGVNRFYTSSHERFSDDGQFINFNLPQFYEIITQSGEQQVIPYRTQGPAREVG
ncbi:class I adenylate cyclase [Aeromonas schubertii]|uniref:Adenylate cyclase n=2 Tax=Aeromonas TaxID=642 RepID=A0ABS7VAQ1_9GAMM|nr:class I adenylate cyclase [Aeromonas schubertii]MBZ6065969.1 class I adenylate cyclase [Aeromonas schubertii]MBZ6072727.1 class I adenylate cyclase [Aeromonas schubertii]